MKKTSVIIGIILGIVGIIAALLGAPVAGVIGGGVAALLGIGAILLGLSARKAGKGMGAVITGAIALILAVVMTVSSIKMMEAVKEQAQAHKDIAPLVAKYCDNTYLGLLGVVINAANAGEDELNELMKQFNKIRDYEEGEKKADAPAEDGSSEAKTEAPQE